MDMPQASSREGRPFRHGLLNHSEFELEVVDAKSLVRHHAPDTVFRESLRLDAQIAKEWQYRRWHPSVALEFDDDGIVHRPVFSGLIIMELQSEIDGQTLRLSEIHQSDTPKPVAYGRYEVIPRQSGYFLQKIFPGTLLKHGIKRCHLRAPLRRLAMIVLTLDFQKCKVAPHVGSHAHLCPGAMACLVPGKHAVRGRIIEICRGISTKCLAFHTLCIIVTFATPQQLFQRGAVSHEFHVRPLHQADGFHFVERDGGQLIKQSVDRLELCQVFSGKGINPQNGNDESVCLCVSRLHDSYAFLQQGVTWLLLEC